MFVWHCGCRCLLWHLGCRSWCADKCRCAPVPLLVLANKQDLPGAMSVVEISEQLQLAQITDRPWYIQPTSAVTGAGLDEGMQWLMEQFKALGR
jgi:signal recognition particle receptor subunit beta